MEETIQRIIYQQPFETDVKIINKVNAKGELNPEVEIKIIRKYENSESIISIIDSDLKSLVEKSKEALNSLLKNG